MILSADGASPLVVQGAPSGVLVTNISTEISAIQMALDYFDAATSHLPALPRSLLLANNLLRAVSQEEIKKFGMGFCTEGKYYDRIIIPIYKNKELNRTISP